MSTVAVLPGTLAAPAPAATRRRHLLRRRGVRRLLVLVSFGVMGDSMAMLAIAKLLVFGLEGGVGPEAIGRSMISGVVPLIVAGPLAGIVADRFDRRRSLSSVAAAKCLVSLIALVAVMADWRGLVYAASSVLVALAGLASTFRAAALPHLVGRYELVTGNSAMGVLAKLAGSFGFLVAGGLASVSTGGAQVTVIAAASVHLATSMGWLFFGRDLGGRVRGPSVVRRDSNTPWLDSVRSTVAMRLVHGVLFVSVLIWVDHTLSLSVKGYAIAIGISGVGTFIGTLLAPLLIQRFHRARSSRMVAFVAVVACASAGLMATRLTVLVMAFCVAISMQVLRVFADSVVQKSVDDRAIGRAYAAYDVSSNAMFLLGGLTVLAVRSAAPRVPSTMWFVVAALGFLLLILHSWTSDRPVREARRAC